MKTRLLLISLLLFIGTASHVAAQEPAESIQSTLPRPTELGAGWSWPWETAANTTFSPVQWRTKFWDPADPRPGLTRMWIEYAGMSDTDFDSQRITAIQTLNQLDLPTSPTHFKTRQDLVALLDAQVSGLADFGYATYEYSNREKDTTPSRSFALRLFRYTPEYLAAHPNEFQFDRKSLEASVAREITLRRSAVDAKEKQALDLLRQLDQVTTQIVVEEERLASLENTRVAPEANASVRELLRQKRTLAHDLESRLNGIKTHRVGVNGSLLKGGDGGLLLWTELNDPPATHIHLIAQHDNVIIDLTETVEAGGRATAELQGVLSTVNLLPPQLDAYFQKESSKTVFDLSGTPHHFQLAPSIPKVDIATSTPAVARALAAPDATSAESGPTNPPPANAMLSIGLPAIPFPPRSGAAPTEKTALLTDKEATELRVEADRAYSDGNLPKAISIYERLLQSRPDDVQATIALGRSQNFLNQLDAAIATYEKVFEMAPDTPNVRTWLVELYLAKGETTTAAKWLDEELEANPESGWALSWVASLHLESGDVTAAQAHFQRAAATDPKVAQYRHQNGVALRSRNLHRRALTDFAAATWMNPEAAGPYYGVAACYAALKDSDSALKWYERYLLLDSTSEWSDVVRREMETLKASSN